MIVGDFIVYLFHYIIARTLYTWASTLGVSPWLLIGVAIVGALLFRHRRRRWRT